MIIIESEYSTVEGSTHQDFGLHGSSAKEELIVGARDMYTLKVFLVLDDNINDFIDSKDNLVWHILSLEVMLHEGALSTHYQVEQIKQQLLFDKIILNVFVDF